MTWQDELRRLDEELAAGRLSAEEYRQLRDALLASKAGQNPSTPTGGEPGAEQQEAGPFPPPFRWDADAPESTQVMRAAGDAGNGAETTQVVPGPKAGQQPTDTERTQVVPGTPHPPLQPQHPPPPHPPPQGQQPFPPMPQGHTVPSWQQSDPGAVPPWTGMDLPPTTDMTPAWYRQGPEVFEPDSGGSNTLRVLGIIGAVVLLVGISIGAYFLFRPSSNNTGGGNNQSTVSPTSPQPTTTTKPPGPPIADLPGQVTDTSKIKNFPDVEGINYLTPQEIEVYRTHGAGESRVAISNDGGIRIIVLVIQQADTPAAVKARDALADLQLRFKMAAINTQPGVLAAANDTVSGGPLRRAHYASGRHVVRVQVQGEDKAQVEQLFTEVLGTQLDELPADA